MYGNVSTKIIHWVYGLPGPKYPVRLRVTYKGQVKYYGSQYGLRMFLTKQEFSAMTGDNPRGVNRERKNAADAYELEVQKIIQDLMPFGFSFEVLQERMRGPMKVEKPVLSDLLKNRAESNVSHGRKRIYNWTAKMVEEFRPGLLVSKVDVKVLEQFEDWMYRRKNSDSTIRTHMKNIHVAMRDAAREELISEKAIPFGRGLYNPPKMGNSGRLSDKKDIAMLIGLRNAKKLNQLARDVFIFCLFCGGANPIDVFSLKRSDVLDGVIRFRRTKTGNYIEIPVTPIVEDVIGRNTDPGSQYLVPLLKVGSYDENHSNKAKINYRLKKMVGHDGISLAYARNNFASYMAQIGTPVDMIAEMMGHSKSTMTAGYMSFPIEEKRESLIKLQKYFTNSL